jgi:class 3 adenylate cyclase
MELLDNVGDTLVPTNSEPIADSFLEATVMFANIVGFTAWSSAH